MTTAQAITRKSEKLTKDDGDEVRRESEQENESRVNVTTNATDNDFKCKPCDPLGEDIQPLRRPCIPKMPSASEVEEHCKTHLPYRSWCKFCVMGRGLGEQRRSHAEVEHMIPRVGIDYWYITSGCIKEFKELGYEDTKEGWAKLLEDRKKGTVVKCLIVRCYETRNVFAHVVPCKGPDEDNYVIDLICSDVAWLGHTKLLLKSDNERPLLSLVARALQAIRCKVDLVDKVSDEHSQEYDSQSNGGTEVGIRAVRGLFRTMRLCLESRIGHSIPPNHPLTSWLIEHVAMTLNANVRGPDGLTGWARARGRDFNLNLYSVGECVLWKQPPKGPQHDQEGNMGPRMFPGVFLGYHRSSNSYRLATENGFIVKSRALQSRPMEERWNAEALKAVVSTPWNLRATTAAERVDVGPRVEPRPVPESDVPPQPRRLKITKKILETYGYTELCEQCIHIRSFGEVKGGLAHSEPCRNRIMEAMAQTSEGKAKLEAQEQKMVRATYRASDAAKSETASATDRPDAPPEASLTGGSSGSGIPRNWRGEPMEASSPVETNPSAVAGHERDSHPRSSACPSSGPAMDESCERPNPPTASEIRERMKIDSNGDDSDMSIVDDVECLMLIGSLGVDVKAYKREHNRSFRKIVSEIYSPPHVTKMLSSMPGHELSPGFALDLTCTDPGDGKPWDFDLAEKREKARRLLRAQKPLFLIGSPMCTAWCAWQRLNNLRRDPEITTRELVQARVHLDFVTSLYREQYEAGRFFLHEHPQTAESWSENSIKGILELPGVGLITADQCQLGQEVLVGQLKGRPVKKATGFMSNAPRLLERLHRRCGSRDGNCTRSKGGRHAVCQGKVATAAARYPPKLCKAILKGMSDEMHARGIMRRGEAGLHAVDDEAVNEHVMKTVAEGYSGKHRDDMTGQILRDDLVQQARALELQYFRDKGVWIKKLKDVAKQRTGKSPISVRWVDVNKGDDLHPRYRSRLVARQLKAHDRSGASFFAPTPPLEALRTVVSFAASTVGDWVPCYDPASRRRMQISFVDISRAYFNAKIDEGSETYVQLPEEDEDWQTHCAMLLRHMYGTRAAADGWQEEYSSFLVESLGFIQGMSSPCVFKHPGRQLIVSVRGDDFTTAGACEELVWFEESLKTHYECTIQPRIGPGENDAKEGVVLNRVIRWTADGIEYEADPRQAEKLVSECGLAGSNTMATPGLRASFAEVEKDQPLPTRLNTAFRGSAARANYLSADRIDCQFAAKEVCRWMAAPTEQSWAALKRLCRYLVGLPRMVYVYRWQKVQSVEVFTDTDWAGCPRTRKSTSGGCVLLGSHTIKSWSSTQTSVALSSGEAEFNGVVRGAGIGLGYQSLLRDLGQELPVRVWTDSSAALGICSRQGLGKLRHLDTHTLWVQHAVRSKKIDLRKIDGERNPADLFTKHSLSRERLMALTALFDCQFRGGRAEAAPQLRAAPGNRTTMAEANTVAEDEQADDDEVIMPHLRYSEQALRKLYPSLEVPEAVDAEDPLNDDGDDLVDAGYRVIKDIIRATQRQGRKRRLRRSADEDAQEELEEEHSEVAASDDGTLNADPTK